MAEARRASVFFFFFWGGGEGGSSRPHGFLVCNAVYVAFKTTSCSLVEPCENRRYKKGKKQHILESKRRQARQRG